MTNPKDCWTKPEIEETFRQVSNWGRWGVDDEKGTLNLITPEKVRAAIGTVRRGRALSIGRDLSPVASGMNPRPMILRADDRGPNAHGHVDEMTVFNHGPQTHLDPVSHEFYQGHVYGGRKVADTVTQEGLNFGSVYGQRDGIVTRGVFLDVAGAQGLPYIDQTILITAQDLARAEESAGVTVEAGDAIFVRAGLAAYQRATNTYQVSPRAGLGPDCALWIHDRDVAVVSNDCTEKLPSICPEVGLTWHVAGLVFMGLAFLDSPDMEALAEACRQERRNEFLLFAAPLRAPGASGSLVNPIVVF